MHVDKLNYKSQADSLNIEKMSFQNKLDNVQNQLTQEVMQKEGMAIKIQLMEA